MRELANEVNIVQLEPTTIYTDNTAAVYIAEDAAAVKRSRADARAAVMIQDAVEEGLFRMKQWPGKNNVADMLTKWLPRNEFVRYRAVILNIKAQRALGMPVDE
jgi:hypothetical protein